MVVYYRQFPEPLSHFGERYFSLAATLLQKERGEILSRAYMHDGRTLFDPTTSYAGQDWRVDETVNKTLLKVIRSKNRL
ncbi:MAG: hypothetical protein IPG53_15670 [Ignavibacteriales bacterium]|nr:hypothetical protein [Ignavibacteriales bacterium]